MSNIIFTLVLIDIENVTQALYGYRIMASLYFKFYMCLQVELSDMVDINFYRLRSVEVVLIGN